MHLVEEQVQRLLHGEVAGSAGREIQGHLAACPECRGRVREAELEDQWVMGRLAALDHPPPPIQASTIMQGARSAHSPRWGRWAAGIFLAAGIVGGAYAAPGSPLPRALASLFESDGAPPTSLAERPERSPAQAGIAVAPGERLTVAFPNGTAGDTAVIALSDADEVLIQAAGGQTSFRSDPKRLVVDHRGASGRFEILIPRTAPLVEVVVGGRRILIKDRSGVTAPVPLDSLGRYVIPLAQSP
ncbi:MAG TPA: zf-HC2 domain-containing protein [Gemmatimonadales bacterium]|nr:zf-HC2 domain-containing protein [Gemmatimonadales bacterium]